MCERKGTGGLQCFQFPDKNPPVRSIEITTNTFYLAPEFLYIFLFFAYMKYAFIIFLCISTIALSAQNWKQVGSDIDGAAGDDQLGLVSDVLSLEYVF